MSKQVQAYFIELLKKTAPPHMNLAEELSELLQVSLDSIYRRLRGETDLTLSETYAICMHYNIPLEALAEINSDMVAFRINKLTPDPESFAQYLKILSGDLHWMSKFPNPKLIYAAEDLPVFYHFYFPKLARFKMVYWNKSLLNSYALQPKKVEENNLPDTWSDAVPKIREIFMNFPTIEIWNEDTLKSTLQQIRFYWEAGFFIEKQSVLEILDDCDGIVKMASTMAEYGKKFNPVTNQVIETPYSLYASDLMIGSNTAFLKSDSHQATYISYHNFNFARTNNRFFNESTEQWLTTFMAKSTLLSTVAEKHRNKFFQKVQAGIDELRQAVLSA